MKVARTATMIAITALGLVAPRRDGALAEGAAPKTCNKAGIEWTRHLTSRGAIAIGGMAATADGGLVVAGQHHGDLRVETPGAAAPSPQAAVTMTSGFLLRLAADGRVRWQRSIPGIDVTIEQEIYSFCHEGDGAQCGDDDGTTTCEIVSADACLGLVSTACPNEAKKNNGRGGTEVNEIRLRPSQ